MHYKYKSTKTYNPDRGLSVAFRQYKADSHCKFLHGYALGIKFTFGANELDVRNWVTDFGGFKNLFGILEDTFDHKTIVAADDPELTWFEEAQHRKILELVILPATGCEKFAEYIYKVTEIWLKDAGYSDRVKLISVEVFEHGANSAIYEGEEEQFPPPLNMFIPVQ